MPRAPFAGFEPAQRYPVMYARLPTDDFTVVLHWSRRHKHVPTLRWTRELLQTLVAHPHGHLDGQEWEMPPENGLRSEHGESRNEMEQSHSALQFSPLVERDADLLGGTDLGHAWRAASRRGFGMPVWLHRRRKLRVLFFERRPLRDLIQIIEINEHALRQGRRMPGPQLLVFDA